MLWSLFVKCYCCYGHSCNFGVIVYFVGLVAVAIDIHILGYELFLVLHILSRYFGVLLGVFFIKIFAVTAIFPKLLWE